jgi:hypothetical protein
LCGVAAHPMAQLPRPIFLAKAEVLKLPYPSQSTRHSQCVFDKQLPCCRETIDLELFEFLPFLRNNWTIHFHLPARISKKYSKRADISSSTHGKSRSVVTLRLIIRDDTANRAHKEHSNQFSMARHRPRVPCRRWPPKPFAVAIGGKADIHLCGAYVAF